MTAVDGQWGFSHGPDVLNDAIESIPPIRFSFFAQHLAILPLTRAAGEISPSIRFLFVGRHGTQYSLNLDDISTLPLPYNTTENPTFLSSGVQVPDCRTLFASMLVCDPQLEVLPATINATVDSLDATILSGVPIVKNVSFEAANYLLGASLLNAARVSGTNISGLTRLVFFPMSTSGAYYGQAFKPLSLDKINQHMTVVIASSANAHLNANTLDSSFSAFATVNTSAVIEVRKLALVGS